MSGGRAALAALDDKAAADLGSAWSAKITGVSAAVTTDLVLKMREFAQRSLQTNSPLLELVRM